MNPQARTVLIVDDGTYRGVGRRNIRGALCLGVVICAGITLSVVVLVLLRSAETYKMQAEFGDVATEHVAAVERAIESKLVVLESLRAYLQSHYPKADRTHFAMFTRPLLNRVHGIEALEWIPRVAHGERAAFEAGANQGLAQPYQIIERDKRGRMIRAGRREEYFPVLLMAPYEGNEPALGYDIGSDPMRWRALKSACDTGATVATDPICLVQGGGQVRGSLFARPSIPQGPPSRRFRPAASTCGASPSASVTSVVSSREPSPPCRRGALTCTCSTSRTRILGHCTIMAPD